jgi:gamma-glutamylaminecyclotransferase
MTGRHRLFVYGTLLAGEANAHHLRGATPLGPAATCALFDLLDLGAFPALRRAGRTSVRGELYLVDPPHLAALDEFEGHPTLFERAVIPLAGGASAEAYLIPAAGLSPEFLAVRPIPGGDWRRRRPAR